MKKEQGFATRAIHAGQQPDPTTGAVMTPIYATSTDVQESPGKHQGYDYARSINPTRLAYEKCIADLESGSRGFAFASGLSAMATVLKYSIAARILLRATTCTAAPSDYSTGCAGALRILILPTSI